jgi:hypothetical protein
MPPRWLSGIIVAFWLATTGWLFWHDLLPRWLAGEPPLFHPDFVDEVQQKSANALTTNWIVERRDEKQSTPYPVFHASTSVQYDKKNDTYSLNASLDATKDPQLHSVIVMKVLKVNSITSAYRVDRSGQLHSLDAEVKVRFDLALSGLGQFFMEQQPLFQEDSSSEPISLRIWGEVRDRQFYAHCSATAKSLHKPLHFDLPPVAVSYKGSVLMPLHPVNHIRGLRLGQSWRQPLVDPLHDAFASLTGFSSGVSWLNARVLPQPEMLKLEDSKTRCLVIVYTNDDNETMGRTWVEQEGERVLQQEAILEGSHWIMKRQSQRSRGR